MPAKKQMNAVALLKADHRVVEDLFEKFENARSISAKQKLAERICTELTVHTMIEEEIFYPSCSGAIDDQNLVQEAYVEHDGAKILIAEISAAGPEDEFFEARVKVLSEQIKHHVKEEEKRAEGLFAEAKDAGLDMDELGEQLKSRKSALIAQIRQDGLPAPQIRSFSGGPITLGRAGPALQPAEKERGVRPVTKLIISGRAARSA